MKIELPPQPNYTNLLTLLYNHPMSDWSKIFREIRLVANRDIKHQPEGGFILTTHFLMKKEEATKIRIYNNQKLILPNCNGFIEVPFPLDFNDNSFVTQKKLNGGGYGGDCLRIEIFICDNNNSLISKRSIGFDSQDICEADIDYYVDKIFK